MKYLLLFVFATLFASPLRVSDAAPAAVSQSLILGKRAETDATGIAAEENGANAAVDDANGGAAGEDTKATPQQLSALEIGRLQVATGVSDALNSTNLIIDQSKSETLTNLANQAKGNLESANTGVENIQASLAKGNKPRPRDQFRVVRGINGANKSIGGFMQAAGDTADANLELNVQNAQTAIANAEGGLQKILDAVRSGGK